MPTSLLPVVPVSLSRGLEALEATASLMVIADDKMWETRARPAPKALGALLYIVHAEIGHGLSELGAYADEPAQRAAS